MNGVSSKPGNHKISLSSNRKWLAIGKQEGKFQTRSQLVSSRQEVSSQSNLSRKVSQCEESRSVNNYSRQREKDINLHSHGNSNLVFERSIAKQDEIDDFPENQGWKSPDIWGQDSNFNNRRQDVFQNIESYHGQQNNRNSTSNNRKKLPLIELQEYNITSVTSGNCRQQFSISRNLQEVQKASNATVEIDEQDCQSIQIEAQQDIEENSFDVVNAQSEEEIASSEQSAQIQRNKKNKSYRKSSQSSEILESVSFVSKRQQNSPSRKIVNQNKHRASSDSEDDLSMEYKEEHSFSVKKHEAKLKKKSSKHIRDKKKPIFKALNQLHTVKAQIRKLKEVKSQIPVQIQNILEFFEKKIATVYSSIQQNFNESIELNGDGSNQNLQQKRSDPKYPQHTQYELESGLQNYLKKLEQKMDKVKTENHELRQALSSKDKNIQKLIRQKDLKIAELEHRYSIIQENLCSVELERNLLQEQLFEHQQKRVGLELQIQDKVRSSLKDLSFSLQERLRRQLAKEFQQKMLREKSLKKDEKEEQNYYLMTIETLSQEIGQLTKRYEELEEKCQIYQSEMKNYQKHIEGQNHAKKDINLGYLKDLHPSTHELMKKEQEQIKQKSRLLIGQESELQRREKFISLKEQDLKVWEQLLKNREESLSKWHQEVETQEKQNQKQVERGLCSNQVQHSRKKEQSPFHENFYNTYSENMDIPPLKIGDSQSEYSDHNRHQPSSYKGGNLRGYSNMVNRHRNQQFLQQQCKNSYADRIYKSTLQYKHQNRVQKPASVVQSVMKNYQFNKKGTHILTPPSQSSQKDYTISNLKANHGQKIIRKSQNQSNSFQAKLSAHNSMQQKSPNMLKFSSRQIFEKRERPEKDFDSTNRCHFDSEKNRVKEGSFKLANNIPVKEKSEAKKDAKMYTVNQKLESLKQEINREVSLL